MYIVIFFIVIFFIVIFFIVIFSIVVLFFIVIFFIIIGQHLNQHGPHSTYGLLRQAGWSFVGHDY